MCGHGQHYAEINMFTPSWLVADRGMESARIILKDLADRLANRVQLSTDGHRAYIYAIKKMF